MGSQWGSRRVSGIWEPVSHSVFVSRPKVGSPAPPFSPSPDTSSNGLYFSFLQSITVPSSLSGQLWARAIFSHHKGVNIEAQKKDETGPRVSDLLRTMPLLCSKAAVTSGYQQNSVPELLAQQQWQSLCCYWQPCALNAEYSRSLSLSCFLTSACVWCP